MSGPEDYLLPHSLGGPPVDLSNCAREPIHIPGSVQPHGALLVLHGDDHRVVQGSVNTHTLLGVSIEELLHQPLAEFVERRDVRELRKAADRGLLDGNAQFTFRVRFGETRLLDATAHRAGELVILELEQPDPHARLDFTHDVKNALSALESATSVQALCDAAAREVRSLTGFDRVMIYRFAPDGSGEVVAENARADLHAFLGHRFPESDIPAQARALYLRSHLRLTADVGAAPVPLEPLVNPVTGAPLDLSGAVLRSTSPIHVQYLKNMGVASSLSVSIVQEGRLWGLISCHHQEALFVPPGVRAACEFLGRVVALQLAAKRAQETFHFREGLRQHALRIVNAVSSTLHPLPELVRPELELVRFARAGGAAVRLEGETALLGECPPSQDVEDMARWLREQGGHEFHTASMARAMPGAERFAHVASGVLAVSLSGHWDEFIVWFRPEIPRTIAWGGDPHKPVNITVTGEVHLTPRRSFDTYVEAVRYTSEPWHDGEIEETASLRVAVIDAMGERLRTLRDLNTRLADSNEELRRFAVVTAHDLQEPLRTMSSFLEMLGARHGGQLDAQGEQLLTFALKEATRLRTLIQDLYAYAEIGTSGIEARRVVDLNEVAARALSALAPAIERTGASVNVGPLPQVWGYAARLEQVFRHLLDNALKFHASGAPRVTVTAREVPGAWQIDVTDSGIGIAPEYMDRIFTIFQRLNRSEAYPGNGTGLAISRKIIERHGGKIWVSSVLGAGSTFSFTLPNVPTGTGSEGYEEAGRGHERPPR